MLHFILLLSVFIAGDALIVSVNRSSEDHFDHHRAIRNVRQCVINIKRHMRLVEIPVNDDVEEKSTFWPILIDPQTEDFKDLSNMRGDIEMNVGDELIIECPGTGNMFAATFLFEFKKLSLTCVDESRFEVNQGSVYDFYEFGCLKQPSNLARSSRTIQKSKDLTHELACPAPNHAFSIGFELENDNLGDERFLTTIETCVDDQTYTVLYSKETIRRFVVSQLVSSPRNFLENEYPIPNIDRYYKPPQMTEQFKRLFGEEIYKKYFYIKEEDDKPIPGGKKNKAEKEKKMNAVNSYLTRGHLSPKSDFVYASQQLATFYFINLNPQFKLFNSRNWQQLEERLRKYAEDQGSDLRVYTGSAGVLELDDKPVYIVTDDSGINRVPIPLLFWKLVWSRLIPGNKMVFISINVPSKNFEDLEKFAENTADEICPVERCSEHMFLEVLQQPLFENRRKVPQGYLACCHYEEFKEKVVLKFPELDIDLSQDPDY